MGSSPVLVGESSEEYQQALAQTLKELNAATPLQIYLAEKIFECLWWMRRYEDQKRTTLIRSMCERLDSQRYVSEMSATMQLHFDALVNNTTPPALRQAIAAKSHTLESLRQEAFDKCRDRLLQLDEMIALKVKTLAGFQASYEVLTNRKLITDRLQLQNSLMRRDLKAIENDQPAKSPGE